MKAPPDPVVITQPTGNLVSLGLVMVGAVAGVAVLGIAFGVPFGAPFALIGIGLLGWFALRAARVRGVADEDGLVVRNLFDRREVRWDEVDGVTVDRRPGGGGWGITISPADGSAFAIEASWGPWYASRGPLAKRNRERCQTFVDRIDALRYPDRREGE